MAELEFRSYDKEKEIIAERNKSRTDYILDAAGITKDNSDYERYYRATITNVHNCYRFSHNNETEIDLENVFESFIDSIKENSIEQYENATKEFLYQRAATQLANASGSYAVYSTYNEMKQQIDDTVKSGMDIRQEKATSFPKEFYTENGTIQRLIYDIPSEDQEESAMCNIDMIVAKHKDLNVSFSTEKNKFIMGKQEIGPEKFFTNKAEGLAGFSNNIEQNPQLFDFSDQEVIDAIKSGDYKKFIELRNTRGMNKNELNKNILRTLGKDEMVFREVLAAWKNKGETNQTKESLLDSIKEVSSFFSDISQLVRKESEKDVLGRIDTVMFSVAPYDIATQSTFKNWKSCMHTTGCKHHYVDDSIGLGSIVAYGYDSKNPSKIVSRILIHPYESANGNIAYKYNDRIYGRDNKGFRKAVANVTDHFNDGKAGCFKMKGGLYRDDQSIKLNLYSERQGVIDLSDYKYDEDGIISLEGFKFSDVPEFIIPEGKKLRFIDCFFDNTTLPKDALFKGDLYFHNTHIPDGSNFYHDDLHISGYTKVGNNTKFDGTVIRFNNSKITHDFSNDNVGQLLLDNCVLGEGCKLPLVDDRVFIHEPIVIGDEKVIPQILGEAYIGSFYNRRKLFLHEKIPVTEQLLGSGKELVFVDDTFISTLYKGDYKNKYEIDVHDTIKPLDGISLIITDNRYKTYYSDRKSKKDKIKIMTPKEFIRKEKLKKTKELLEKCIIYPTKKLYNLSYKKILNFISNKMQYQKVNQQNEEQSQIENKDTNKNKDKQFYYMLQQIRGIKQPAESSKISEDKQPITKEQSVLIKQDKVR